MQSRETAKRELERLINGIKSYHIGNRYNLIKEYVANYLENPYENTDSYMCYLSNFLQDSVDIDDLVSFEYLLENVNYDKYDLNIIKNYILSEQKIVFIVVFYEIRLQKHIIKN